MPEIKFHCHAFVLTLCMIQYGMNQRYDIYNGRYYDRAYVRGDGPNGSPANTYSISNDTSKNGTLHHCFQSSIYVTAFISSQTGEFRCSKLHHPDVYSYTYVYANGINHLLNLMHIRVPNDFQIYKNDFRVQWKRPIE